MSILEIFVCVLVPCVVGLLGYTAGLAKRLKEQEELGDRRNDSFHTALANLAKTVCDLDDRISDLDDRISDLDERHKKLDGEFRELPKEEMEAEYQRLVSFNTGIQNIIGFGPDVPKLNKEAIRSGGVMNG